MSIKGVTFVLALVVSMTAVAHAASAAEKAEIVYANDGQIISAKADGTGRTALTRTRHLKASHDYDTDWNPEISPDGRSLVFSRYLHQAKRTDRLMVSDRDGGNARPVFAVKGMNRLAKGGWRYVSIESPTWSESSRRIYFVLDVRWSSRDLRLTSANRVMSVRPDGSDRKVHYVMRGYPSSGNPPKDSGSIDSIDLAPDGRHLLIGWWRDRDISELVSVLDLKTERLRFVHEGTDPSWSPSGSRIVFSSDFERLGRRNSGNHGEYSLDHRVYVVRSDGSGLTRVVKGYGPGDEYDPDFSPDGSRITFTSDRNDRDAYSSGFEIYTVRPDGKCLSWVSNGAPESTEATWGPEPGLDPSPGSCGGQGLAPTVERMPNRLKGESGLFPETHYWLGPHYRGINFTGGSHEVSIYDDCGVFNPRGCVSNWSVSTEWVCRYYDRDEFDYTGVATGLQRRRGAVVMTMRHLGGGRSITVFSGRQEISPHGGMGLDDQLRALDDLRLIGQAAPAGDLPEAILDSRVVNLASRVKASFELTASIDKTASELNLSRDSVLSYLNIHRDLGEIGPVESARCPD